MRHRAKPFTVEIRKSRKAASEPQSLFGVFDIKPAGFAEPPMPATERSADKPQHPAGAEALALADQVFGASPAAADASRPATRILPDLTARAPEPAREDEAPKGRARRIKLSPKPKIPRPKPVPISPVPALAARPVARKGVPVPPRRIRVRAPRDGGDLLPRGERWKRRLPRFAR